MFIAFLFMATAPIELKQALTRQLGIESFQEAAVLADQLSSCDDPEGYYLAISAYAGANSCSKALEILEAHRKLLQEHNYYKKALEALALGVFKTHFQATQEPIKLASLAAISMQSDARVLDLILEAFEHPSLKVKMLALRNLTRFADEKVKRRLFQAFKTSPNPVCGIQIARLFAQWQDKRILPLLYQKLHEDALSLDEKISYIQVIKELCQKVEKEKMESLVQSSSASERILAAHLLAAHTGDIEPALVRQLLLDPHLWVKQAALMTVIKKKLTSPHIEQVILGWKEASSFELVKGYYYWGLVNHHQEVLSVFKKAYSEASEPVKKTLAAILYAAGPDHETLVKELIKQTDNPAILLQLGLYLLASSEPKPGVELISCSLKQLQNRKIFAVSESILPLFVIEDESNSALSLTAGQRRAMDKHIRLKIFHLLAIKKMAEAKEILKQLLKSDLFEVSLDAMIHFWENFGIQDSEYLKGILNEHDPELRLKAALVLSYLDYDKEIRKFLMESFYKQPYQMQIQILFALSKYHEEDVLEFYTKQLRSKYPLLQAVSAGCLFTALYN